MSEAPSSRATRRPASPFGDPPRAAAPILPLLVTFGIGLAGAAVLIAIHFLERL